MDKEISVAVISEPVGKSPEEVACSFVFDEVYRLAKKGVNMYVIRGKIEGGSISYGIHFHGIEKLINPQALNVFMKNIMLYPPISLVRNPIHIYWENLYASNVSKIIEKYNIDLIHAHFAYREGLVGLLAKAKTKKPLIVTCHGYDILFEPTIKYGVRLSRRINSIVHKVLNSADAILTASKATFNECKKIVSDTDKIYLIPNGVDVEKFNPHINGFNIRRKHRIEGYTVVFTLRGHVPKNGLEYLIKAVPRVLSEKKNVIFVIGGDGPLRRYHERLATKLNVKEKIIFTGIIPQNLVPYYYAMSDIVVVPSLQEAFGLVVTEAMACGKPVIGTRVGGIPDQIIDGYNGFLVKPRSPEEIAEKIIYLVDNPDEARHMGMNGRRIVEERFNIEKRVEKIISIYEEVLSAEHFGSV